MRTVGRAILVMMLAAMLVPVAAGPAQAEHDRSCWIDRWIWQQDDPRAGATYPPVTWGVRVKCNTTKNWLEIDGFLLQSSSTVQSNVNNRKTNTAGYTIKKTYSFSHSCPTISTSHIFGNPSGSWYSIQALWRWPNASRMQTKSFQTKPCPFSPWLSTFPL